MKIPFRLARLESPAGPADAGLLLADDAAALAKACATIRPFPTVFRVAGGFLLLASALPPGTIRLRRLGGDLFVPVDAQLLPRLLPDEIVGLTKTRGLIVLADGALAFDPTRPLLPNEWLKPPRVRREVWTALPEPPALADRLTAIERPSPPGAVLEILAAGEPDDANPLAGKGQSGGVPEDARPVAGSMLGQVGAGTLLGVAQLAAWMGKQLNAPSLGNLAGKLARKAVEKVPRITEKILGDQEAALREVLRQLQSGDIEKALKRAPIAVGDPTRTPAIDTSAKLTPRDPRFSLRDLLGGGGGAAWLGGGDVWNDLAREYRRLAEEAARHGDARRAAYLYGVLLRDVRAAANALMAGGYFHDAAILYRDKLADPLAAAKAFERAGEYDEAVRLYERREDYEAAAELLRRIGDEDRAVEYFERASDRLRDRGQWLEAGDLVRKKLGRREAATALYRAGWKRGGANHLACGERLIDEVLVAESWAAFDELLDEAMCLESSTHASRFFNYALDAGRDSLPVERMESARDRVQLFYARRLRENPTSIRRAGEQARELFAPKGGWTGPQVRDAEFAARALAKRSNPTKPDIALAVPPADGTLTAVAVARVSRDLVLAVGDRVSVWRSATGETVRVAQLSGARPLGLATNDDATTIHVLYADATGVHLKCYGANPTASVRSLPAYLAEGQIKLCEDDDAIADWYLQPASYEHDGEPVVALVRPGRRTTFYGTYLREETMEDKTNQLVGPKQYLLANLGPAERWEWDENFLRHVVGSQTRREVTNWTPAVPDRSPLRQPAADWISPSENFLQLVGIDAGGVLRWHICHDPDPDHTMGSAHFALPDGHFTAACFRGPGHMAAATANGEIHWFNVISGYSIVTEYRPTPLGHPSRIAFLAMGRSRDEVLAVFADGQIARVRSA